MKKLDDGSRVMPTSFVGYRENPFRNVNIGSEITNTLPNGQSITMCVTGIDVMWNGLGRIENIELSLRPIYE